MEVIRGIYVDSFRVKKANCIYFLTHWHADHYWGLTTNWNYGPIYCSVITRKILLTKYPKLSQITYGLQLNQTYTLLTPQGQQFTVTLFNSNHIAGSVLILFHYKLNNTYILHTGDMRFNTHCLQQNPQLFQYNKQINQYSCKYLIDTLYLDNTYCDPIFMFPNRSDALIMIRNIIERYGPGTRMIYLVTDSIGKEQAFVALSLYYNVYVTLWGQRMQYIKQMYTKQLINKLFCTKQQALSKGSWIEVIKRRYVQKTLQQDPRAIAIKLTGWANLQDSHPLSQRQFIVPYSLHSNYQELELFMSVIRPKNLFPVVRLNHKGSKKFKENIHSYGSYFGSLMHMKQRGFNFFVSNYLSVGFSKKRQSSIGTNKEKQKENGNVNIFKNQAQSYIKYQDYERKSSKIERKSNNSMVDQMKQVQEQCVSFDQDQSDSD